MHMDLHVKLARQAVEAYIREREKISPPSNFPQDLSEKKAGVFVTISDEDGKIRGCIGTYQPTKNSVAEEIIDNAISAATKDSRFKPLTESELNRITYCIYVLSALEKVKNLSDLNPERYGILLKAFSGKSALLLPGLPGIENAKEQFLVACQKGGIDPDEKISIYRFKAQKYE